MKFWVQKMLRSKKYFTEKFPDSKNLLGQDDFCIVEYTHDSSKGMKANPNGTKPSQTKPYIS